RVRRRRPRPRRRPRSRRARAGAARWPGSWGDHRRSERFSPSTPILAYGPAEVYTAGRTARAVNRTTAGPLAEPPRRLPAPWFAWRPTGSLRPGPKSTLRRIEHDYRHDRYLSVDD